ncbi:MAG: hypothetical protein QF682_05535 [Candidatus Thermoplasmatota archaeon]|nr:hypothetical protein [Candidatus Thermoplasmatota archaeon]
MKTAYLIRKSMIFLFIFVILFGSILAGIGLLKETDRSVPVIEDIGEESNFPETRAFPWIQSVSPANGYLGSVHEIRGSEFGESPGKLGLENESGVIFWINYDDWGNFSINFTVPNNLTEGDFTIIVEHSDGNRTYRNFSIYAMPTITLITPSQGPFWGKFRIVGENLGDNGGRVVFYTIVENDHEVEYFPIFGEWSDTGINISRLPDGVSSGEFYVITQAGLKSNNLTVTLTDLPKISEVTPKGAIYRSIEVTISGTGFGSSSIPLLGDFAVLYEMESGYGENMEMVWSRDSSDITEWQTDGSNKSIIKWKMPYWAKLGSCRIIVEANGTLSEPFTIKVLKAEVVITEPEMNETVSGSIDIVIKIPKGTKSVNVTIYPFETENEEEYGSEDNSQSKYTYINITVSKSDTSATVKWDTTDVENEKKYVIYARAYSIDGGYGDASAESIEVYVKQVVVSLAGAIVAMAVGIGVTAGAGVMLGGGTAVAGSAGAASAGTTAQGAVSGAGGSSSWFMKLLNKIRALFGDMAEEKMEDLLEKGGEKVDDKLDEKSFKKKIKKSVPIRAFIISAGIATIAFALFINGGFFGWKGWIDLLIALPFALLIVAALMGVKNLFLFWLGDKTKVKKRWRMGIVGLFLLVVTCFLSSPMGDIGEIEDRKWKHRKKAKKYLLALGVMGSSLVLLSMLVIFGALSIIDSGFLRFTVAYPGAMACIILAFFPLLPFKGSPGNNIWKVSKVVNIGVLVGIMAVYLMFTQLWIPGWSLIIVGGGAALILTLLLFMFGVLGDLTPFREIKARKYIESLTHEDSEKRKQARKKLLKMCVKYPNALRSCSKDIIKSKTESPVIFDEILDLVSIGSDVAPWLFIPHTDRISKRMEKASEDEGRKWAGVLVKLENERKNIEEYPDEEVRKSLIKLIENKDEEEPEPETSDEEAKAEPDSEESKDEEKGDREIKETSSDEPDVDVEKEEKKAGELETKEEKFDLDLDDEDEDEDQNQDQDQDQESWDFAGDDVDPEKPPADTEADSEDKKCPRCGAPLAPPYRFCTGCGMSMDEGKETEESEEEKEDIWEEKPLEPEPEPEPEKTPAIIEDELDVSDDEWDDDEDIPPIFAVNDGPDTVDEAEIFDIPGVEPTESDEPDEDMPALPPGKPPEVPEKPPDESEKPPWM